MNRLELIDVGSFSTSEILEGYDAIYFDKWVMPKGWTVCSKSPNATPVYFPGGDKRIAWATQTPFQVAIVNGNPVKVWETNEAPNSFVGDITTFATMEEALEFIDIINDPESGYYE